MATYCVSFRLANKTIGGKSYDERRKLIETNVWAKGQGYWDETTSFILAGSDLDTFSFAKKASEGLGAKDDILLVFDPSDMSAAYFGPVDSPEILGSFFNVLKKVD
ncbi:hypothetical protein Q669_10915 [Labrenzia sp. C1B10]|uniref:hypothetical protein n=1 Tax=unclassified Labrenzia TaxID=2648686 RepID=UPI0003B8E702|nr:MULTISPECIES: hypothetical protein [unclassified Labrenzia]ERP87267.1 hypothetical protein Q669_10915 [Labrenzia sp. C1B10]ERS07571.1 hypothetical protein Q675_19550 [Labrenzia sp. C1B70]